MDDKTLEMSLLFDFYGELLTEKQREYFDLYYNDDLSLGEIADNVGISRQGVRDIIVRAENLLTDTERKTGLVERFTQMRSLIEEALNITSDIRFSDEDTEKVKRLSEILEQLKG